MYIKYQLSSADMSKTFLWMPTAIIVDYCSSSSQGGGGGRCSILTINLSSSSSSCRHQSLMWFKSVYSIHTPYMAPGSYPFRVRRTSHFWKWDSSLHFTPFWASLCFPQSSSDTHSSFHFISELLLIFLNVNYSQPSLLLGITWYSRSLTVNSLLFLRKFVKISSSSLFYSFFWVCWETFFSQWNYFLCKLHKHIWWIFNRGRFVTCSLFWWMDTQDWR